jgi:hypothetical protein
MTRDLSGSAVAIPFHPVGEHIPACVKLLVALWKYVSAGVVLEGATITPT